MCNIPHLGIAVSVDSSIDRSRASALSVDEWVRQSHMVGAGIRIRRDPRYGLPLNPKGRTGLRGRAGFLHWGPNFTSDAVITREVKVGLKTITQVLLVRRPDLDVATSAASTLPPWGLPGGDIRCEDKAAPAARREFVEFGASAISERKPAEQASAREAFVATAETVWSRGHTLYAGYIDHARNTDNAWIEWSAVAFHSDLAESSVLATGRIADGATPYRKWAELDALCDAHQKAEQPRAVDGSVLEDVHAPHMALLAVIHGGEYEGEDIAAIHAPSVVA